jgi:oligopeptide/dipeptide ABC transporter ATP-binding protein
VTPLLEVLGLTTTFPVGPRRVPVVDGVSFSIAEGEVFALIGESGSGKSQTALSLLRLVPKPGRIEGGHVRLGGREISSLPVPAMRRVRGHDLSMIFQEPMTSLNPVVRVGSQVVEAIRLHERISASAARDRALSLFKKVQIPDASSRLDAYPHELSGGLKQRVMIAMALATNPRVLIADEPTTALDVTIQAQILELLREIQQEFRMSILLITHDFGIVNELADHIGVMYAGRIVETGPRQALLASPRHPYTQGLLASMPARAVRGQPLHEIAGVVPPLSKWPPGCRFCTRCPRVLPQCETVWPEVLEVGPGHTVNCHAVREDVAAAAKRA